jgi:long-chain acyl-CoA synthetase
MAHDDTIYTLIRDAARRFNMPVALAGKRDGQWRPISHERMMERVRHISLGLDSLGVRRGDRVAILSESRPEWTLVDLGTLGVGAALVPIYPTLTADQISYIVEDSGAKTLVVSSAKLFDKIAPLLPNLPAIENVVSIETLPADDNRPVTPLERLEEIGERRDRESPDMADRIADEGKPDDLATLIYTSGTTGRQKGVVLTNRNFVANIHGTFADTSLFTSSDVALSYLPLSHIFERTAVYGLLRQGASIYYASSFDTVAADLRDVRPTVVTSVPRLFEKMYEKIQHVGATSTGLRRLIFDRSIRAGDTWARAVHAGKPVSPLVQLEKEFIADRLVFEKWRDAVGGRLRFFVSGGAPLGPDIAYAFLGAGIPIYEGYGLTETSPVIALNYPDAHRIGTVGRPLGNLDVRIAADGEICVKGPSVMQGYYNLHEETSAAFDDEGYFLTGDVGHIDDAGFLKITDRKKDLLKTSNGKYVAPQPIENAIKASSLVSQAVVIGDKRKFCSALIVPNFAVLQSICESKGIKGLDHEALVNDPRVVKLVEDAVAAQTPGLARHEQIKKVALLPRELTIDAGEITPTLKVKRRVVEEKYRHVIDAIYADAGERETTAHA